MFIVGAVVVSIGTSLTILAVEHIHGRELSLCVSEIGAQPSVVL